MQSTAQQQLFSLPCQNFYLAIASNPLFLSKGYELVYKYLSLNPQNRQNTLLHLLSEKVPILTLVTRTYPVVYATQSSSISVQQRNKTKQYLILEILMKKLVLNKNKQNSGNKKNLGNFLLFLNQFHHNQGFQEWVPYYQKLLEQLIISKSDLIGYILIEIMKNSDDRVSSFSKHILNFVINNQTSMGIAQQQSLEIIYYCIKSMAYLNGTDDQLLQKYFQPHQQQILAYIQSRMTKSIKIMKYSLKILTVFVADYEIELQDGLIKKIVECSKQLVSQFINSRISASKQQQDDQQMSDNDYITIKVILYQLLQLIETLINSQQLKIFNFQFYLSICLPSLLLNNSQYMSYKKSTQSYLVDIQDEAERNLRNKVVSFLLELYQGNSSTKSKAKMESFVLKYTLLLLQSKNNDFGQHLAKIFSDLEINVVLKQEQLILFEQSMSFLLFHLTEQILTSDPKNLKQNKQNFIMNLGKNIYNSDPLIQVSYLNLLNKLIKSMEPSVITQYYSFLIDIIYSNTASSNTGLLLCICRGIAYASNNVQLGISMTQNNKCIPFSMLQALVKILLNPQTLQQSAHLILQFLLTLLKKCTLNELDIKTVFKQLLPGQVQLHILTTFIHDGMIADVVVDILGQIASQQVVKYIYGQYLKGGAKQQNLSLLISKWIKNSIILITEHDILTMLKVYSNSFISKIIKQYLNLVQLKGIQNMLTVQVVESLNKHIHSSWILAMIGCKILKNPQVLFINTVQKITYQLTSQSQIQYQLLLPYYIFLNDCTYGLNMIRSKSLQLYEAFLTKLIRYASLFQGSNLKVITSLVLLNICQLDKNRISQVLDLISSYGNSSSKGMQDQQWQDQNDKDEQQNVIDRMFNMKITNDEVEEQFKEIFGPKTTDMQLVNAKIQLLTRK